MNFWNFFYGKRNEKIVPIDRNAAIIQFFFVRLKLISTVVWANHELWDFSSFTTLSLSQFSSVFGRILASTNKWIFFVRFFWFEVISSCENFSNRRNWDDSQRTKAPVRVGQSTSRLAKGKYVLKESWHAAALSRHNKCITLFYWSVYNYQRPTEQCQLVISILWDIRLTAKVGLRVALRGRNRGKRFLQFWTIFQNSGLNMRPSIMQLVSLWKIWQSGNAIKFRCRALRREGVWRGCAVWDEGWKVWSHRC